MREQFGKKIGAFQAIKHLCARDARDQRVRHRRRLGRGLGRRPTSVGAAGVRRRSSPGRSASTAPSRSPRTASRCSAGSASPSSTTPTSTCAAPSPCVPWSARRARTPPGWPTSPRRDVRRARAHRPRRGRGRRAAPRSRAEAERIAALPEARAPRALAETGFLTPHWPAPHGLGADPVHQLVIDEELARAGVERPDLKIGAWAAPTILAHGNDEQRDRFVGPDAARRDRVVPAVQRARRRVRPGVAAHQGGA